MKIEILIVGRPKNKFTAQGAAHYINHLNVLAPVKIVAVKSERLTKDAAPKLVRRAEGQRILSRVHSRAIVIALDQSGRRVSSKELADLFGQWESSGRNRLTFIVGGPLGLDEKVKTKAEEVLSLSRLTFSHELSLLMALEQIYRALSLRAGRPYAK